MERRAANPQEPHFLCIVGVEAVGPYMLQNFLAEDHVKTCFRKRRAHAVANDEPLATAVTPLSHDGIPALTASADIDAIDVCIS